MSRQSDLDNHANQMNPNNDAYWEARGQGDCPSDGQEPAVEDQGKSSQKQ